MQDFGEFRQHWRALFAASVGLASALSLNGFILSTFAPYLIAEFEWTRAEWAMLGIVQMLTLITLPIAGRLTDIFGARPVAAVGALSFPVCLVAIAAMSGNIRVYLAIYIVQTALGSATTQTVYSRVVAEAFRIRRGLALGVLGCSTPLVAAVGAPTVTVFVDSHGWRAGYLAVAAFCAFCSILTLSLLPPSTPRANAKDAASPARFGVYQGLAATPAFWMMLCATLFVNFPFSIVMSQLKVVALDQGLSDYTAAFAISAFAVGSVAGRILSGFALDTLPPHVVAATVFAMPVVGLAIFALDLGSSGLVIFAIILMGLSYGSEGDVIPMLVTRWFDLSVYSTVMGLLSAAIGSSLALGNLLIGISLSIDDSFRPYYLFAAGLTSCGCVLFLLLGRLRFGSVLRVD